MMPSVSLINFGIKMIMRQLIEGINREINALKSNSVLAGIVKGYASGSVV